MTEVVKDVNVARMLKPKFLSLVGLPAGQVAFKVIRDDTGEPTMTAPHIQRKRTKRADPLLSIAFEPGVTEEEVKKAMADWGVEDYTVEQDGDMQVVKRAEADGAPTIKVNLGNGRTATILKPISQTRSDVKQAISVSAIEFAPDYFPAPEDIAAWCKANDIDFSQDAVENGAQQTVVRLSGVVAEGEEVRRVEVDGGVCFVVARAETQDIPANFITAVNDTAFGSWGWGQLDFAATMADIEFCGLTEEAVYQLNRVLDRILFYSDLPVSVRKELVVAATGQFADFVVTLMDALPARVVVASRSIIEKEKLMSKEKEQNGKAVERQDETDVTKTTEQAAEKTEGTQATEVTETAETFTRADVEKMIGDAVGGISAQLTALQATLTAAAPAPVVEAQRNDGTSGEGEGKANGKDDAAGDQLTEVLRSINESMTGLNERLQNLEGTTIVRSDEGDGKQSVKQRKDVFAGMFGKAKQS